MLAAAALGGCTSTRPATPGFTESAAAAGADAGYAPALPDTVAVLPEPSGLIAVAASQPATAPASPPAAEIALAGPTPQAGSKWPEAVATGGAKAMEQVFPAPPVLAAAANSDRDEIAALRPVAYSGPVPSYLAPTRPLASKNAFAETTAPRGRGDIEKLIDKYAVLYEVPVGLVRHVVNRESTFNPKAYNHGHWGLMQIKHATARGMGYDGPASGLFDPETNLKYAVKYLRGAWMVANGDARRADRLYQTGYYYAAKKKGLLDETGLGRDRVRRRLSPTT